MKKFNFYHLTDLHYYANEVIGSYGEKFDKWCNSDQKCIAQSSAILDSAIESILKDDTTDIVLISGDLTCDGEKESHFALREKLRYLQEKGKKVYVTFATHDFRMHAKKFEGNKIITLDKLTRAQLREHYGEFGFNNAIAEHESYSYCVQLTEDTRLLCLNDDGDGDKFCGYYNDLLFWIKAQVEDAKKAGCEIFAMTHHPILEPSPVYPLVSHKAMLGGYEFAGPYLANLGIKYIFVGHTHIHDINSITTKQKNTMYQINTGALCGHPLAYRKVEFSDEGMDIKTLHVEEIDFDLGGKNVRDFAAEHFTYMIREFVESLDAGDIDHFIKLVNDFSQRGDVMEKIRPLLTAFGPRVAGITFGTLGKLLFISSQVDDSVKDRKFFEFIVEVVLNMYGGTEKYSPETGEYKAMTAICKRFSPILKFKNHAGESVDLVELIANTIYNSGIDAQNVKL